MRRRLTLDGLPYSVSSIQTASPSYSDGEDLRFEAKIGFARFVRTHLSTRPTGRCAFVQCDVRSVIVIVRQILTPKPSQVLFVQRDDVIHQLTPTLPTHRSAIPFCQGLRKLARIGSMPLAFRGPRTLLPNFASRSNRT